MSTSPIWAPAPVPAVTAFRPGMAVMLAMVAMFFCITFLALLYARRCNAGRGDGVVSYYMRGGGGGGAGGVGEPPRKNSGVERGLVEALPVFRFGDLRGQKEGLECAVCLSRFEAAEALRLLPGCRHAFHVECVDTWLDAHSTCPLCRRRLVPEDLLLRIPSRSSFALAESIRRISGRHSSAGERGRDRKDGLLIPSSDRKLALEHRIVISGPTYDRWSDVLPSDLVFLRSELRIDAGAQTASRSSDPETRQTAGALARWTAWISQPTHLRSLPS